MITDKLIKKQFGTFVEMKKTDDLEGWLFFIGAKSKEEHAATN